MIEAFNNRTEKVGDDLKYNIKSKSKNSPFIGRRFKGRVKYTIVQNIIII